MHLARQLVTARRSFREQFLEAAPEHGSDSPLVDGHFNPRNNFIKHFVETCRAFDAKHTPGLLDGGHTALDIVLKGVVRNNGKGRIGALDLPPNQLIQEKCQSQEPQP